MDIYILEFGCLGLCSCCYRPTGCSIKLLKYEESMVGKYGRKIGLYLSTFVAEERHSQPHHQAFMILTSPGATMSNVTSKVSPVRQDVFVLTDLRSSICDWHVGIIIR